MGHYKANSINSHNFNLTSDDQQIGALVYSKWYSFNADILLADGSKYELKSKDLWDSKIELKDSSQNTLLEFKMGWKGILIKCFFDTKETTYLLKLKGLFSNKFTLIDAEKTELLVAETDFKWSKFSYDYHIETTPVFEQLGNSKLFLLTLLHCVNYYMNSIATGG